MLVTKFSKNARIIRSDAGLTRDQLAYAAPSILAEGAHESRSLRYSYIPTIQVLDFLAREGFYPVFACQAKTRDAGHMGHTKHMLRIRHRGQQHDPEAANEIILINSHNGASSYQMLAGCFRFVCQNGLVSGDAKLDVRVKHSGDPMVAVVEGAHEVLGLFGKLDEEREGFRLARLDSGEQRAYATAALALRFGVEAPPPVSVDQVLTPRRLADADSSLWSTFQRVQENLEAGGLRTTGRSRRGHTRPVTGIDGSVALNRGLWALATEMQRLRAA